MFIYINHNFSLHSALPPSPSAPVMGLAPAQAPGRNTLSGVGPCRPRWAPFHIYISQDPELWFLNLSSHSLSHTPSLFPCVIHSPHSHLPSLSTRTAFMSLSRPFSLNSHPTNAACKTHSFLRNSVHSLFIHRQPRLRPAHLAIFIIPAYQSPPLSRSSPCARHSPHTSTVFLSGTHLYKWSILPSTLQTLPYLPTTSPHQSHPLQPLKIFSSNRA